MFSPRFLHVDLVGASDLGEYETVLDVPGIRRYDGRLRIPLNAIGGVPDEVLDAYPAVLGLPLPRTLTEEELRARLEGHVKEFALVPGFLTSYQIDALRVSADHPGFSFWHPTGSGKTLTAILRTRLNPGPTLTITRAASRIQYARKGWRWLTHEDAYVIRGESSLRVKDERLDAYVARMQGEGRDPCLVTSWESLAAVWSTLEDLGVAKTLKHVIFDEVHNGKNHKRWETQPLPELPLDPSAAAVEILRQEGIARRVNGFIRKNEDTGDRILFIPATSRSAVAARIARAVPYRTCTTATSIKNRLSDLYAQLDLAEPGAWGSATEWLTRYADRKPTVYGGYEARGMTNVDELAERLQFAVHHVDSAVTTAALPPKRRESYYIRPEHQDKPLGGWQRELKAAAARGASALLETKLAMSASQKRTAIRGLLRDHIEERHKIVIFTGRRLDVENLGAWVEKQFEIQAWAAHGGIDADQRNEVVEAYMSHPGPCVLIGTGDAFGEALDLQDTDAALFVQLPWTPGQLRQWEGRFSRLGQKRPVLIYYVIAEGTVDEHVAARLIEKIPAVERLTPDSSLDGASAALGGLDNEEEVMASILEDLFGLDIKNEINDDAEAS